MPRTLPYQPFLLRLLHGLVGILAITAIVTGFWVYNTYDGRWGKLPLPSLGDIQGIHGTFALLFLIGLPFLALYSFHPGQRRLIQADGLSQLIQNMGKPIGWIALQRLTNTAMLVAATFAVLSGRMMKEEWLPAGDLDRFWYGMHLLGWAGMVIALALHLLMSAKVGGVPLLLSMWTWKYRPEDSPALWIQKIQAIWQGWWRS